MATHAKTAPALDGDGAAELSAPRHDTTPASLSQCPECGADTESHGGEVYTSGPEPVPSHIEWFTICTRKACGYYASSAA
jgi:hypothetical protein